MSVELNIVNKKDAEKWDKLVNSSPHGTIFHTWKWLKIAEKYTNLKLYPIISYKGTEPIGIIPLFYKKKFIKMVFSPPPYAAIPYLGPVLKDYDKLKEDKRLSFLSGLQREIDNFIFSELKANYISISLPPGMLDCRPFIWTGYHINLFFNYILDLSKGYNYIWMQFKRKLRGDIERARKRGVYVEEGYKEELSFIYDALIERYREQNRAVYVPKNYLFDLYDEFYPQNLRIFVAKYENEPVGGLVALCYKNKISFWIGAAKSNVRGVSPNDLVQWEAMKWACEHGFKYYEEIGAGTERLAQFKAKYNPILSVCFSAKKYSSLWIKLIELSYEKKLRRLLRI